MTKEWTELGISNDFLFGKIMRDPELCKELLEVILNVPIARVEYPEEQKTIDISQDARSVRLDVYVADGNNTVYDIEMQTVQEKDLPKRSRYYQGMIDLSLIEKGEPYNHLNRSYVIFICTFDAFGKEESVYTFENMCKEVENLPLGDETHKIFLNAQGASKNVSPQLKAFLQYVAGNLSEDPFVKKLDNAVIKAKNNEEWRREYMTLLMRDRENLEKGGSAEGRAEGRTDGYIANIRLCQRFHMSKEAALNELKHAFSLSDAEAQMILNRHWDISL